MGEAYTEKYDATDYKFAGTIIPKTGTEHRLLVRVQGTIRNYPVGLSGNNRLVLEKKNEFAKLTETDFAWDYDSNYGCSNNCIGNTIEVSDDNGQILIKYTDSDNPYLHACIGAGVKKGSHCRFIDFKYNSIV